MKVGDIVVHKLRPDRDVIVTAIGSDVDCRWWEDRLVKFCSETFGIEELKLKRG